MEKLNIQETILTKVRELGDLLERAGEKIERHGYQKIGEEVYKLGNRIEHFRESKKDKV